MTEEQALVAWKEIEEFLRCPLWAGRRKKLREAGIIFTRTTGTPPNRKTFVYTFPSLLQRFLIKNPKF